MIKFTRPVAKPVLHRGKAILLLGIGCPAACLTSVASATSLSSGGAQAVAGPMANIASPGAFGAGAGAGAQVAAVPLCAANAVAGRAISPGEVAHFDFIVANATPSPVCFEIAGAGAIKIKGPASLLGVQCSTDRSGAYLDVKADGASTTPIAPGASVRVRIVAGVNGSARPGQTIRVVLGESAVAAVDAASGRRQAVAGASEMVIVQPDSETSAAVYLSENGYIPGGAPDSLAQDVLVYGLGVGVNAFPESDGYGGASTGLGGASIKLDGARARRILISSAIPMLTTLAGAPVAPDGWQVVYSSTPLTLSALNAAWTTTRPPRSAAPLPLADASITRIGFVTDKTLAPGKMVTGFSFRVMTTGAVPNRPITAICQLFGQTSVRAGSPVYDKDGDHMPTSAESEGSEVNALAANPTSANSTASPSQPQLAAETKAHLDSTAKTKVEAYSSQLGASAAGPAPSPAATVSSTTTQTATPAAAAPAAGIATGSATATATAIPVVAGKAPPTAETQIPVKLDGVFYYAAPQLVENGPEGQPNAVGPTGTDDDFTNCSAFCPPGLAPGATFDPDPVMFINTVANPGTAVIASLTLEPQSPSPLTNLPVGTVVSLASHTGTACYTFTGSCFKLTDGAPATIVNLAPGRTANYSVAIDLPPGTPQSADIGHGFPVAIRAFDDTGGHGTYTFGDIENTTIDRVYTGCIKLTQQARIVDADGKTIIQDFGSRLRGSSFKPGRFIDYRIVYRNITDPGVGKGNIIVEPYGLTLTNNGTNGSNDWANRSTWSGIIATSNVVGSATDSSGGAISFYKGRLGDDPGKDQSGQSASADVSQYVDTISHALSPGLCGTFSFRRRIN